MGQRAKSAECLRRTPFGKRNSAIYCSKILTDHSFDAWLFCTSEHQIDDGFVASSSVHRAGQPASASGRSLRSVCCRPRTVDLPREVSLAGDAGQLTWPRRSGLWRFIQAEQTRSIAHVCFHNDVKRAVTASMRRARGRDPAFRPIGTPARLAIARARGTLSTPTIAPKRDAATRSPANATVGCELTKSIPTPSRSNLSNERRASASDSCRTSMWYTRTCEFGGAISSPSCPPCQCHLRQLPLPNY